MNNSWIDLAIENMDEIARLTRRNDRMRAALVWIRDHAREAGCSVVIEEAEAGLDGE